MDKERVKESLNKIPLVPLVGAILLYYGYDYYSFENDSTSPKLVKQVLIRQSKNGIKAQKKKLEDIQTFYKKLDVKRDELRSLALKLGTMKATLSESLDVPQFLKMVITEARRVGLEVMSLRPREESKEDYYIENGFELKFKGVYVQMLVFLNRMAEAKKIIRIEDFNLKPLSSGNERFVVLSGALNLKVYRYSGSVEDNIGKGQ